MGMMLTRSWKTLPEPFRLWKQAPRDERRQHAIECGVLAFEAYARFDAAMVALAAELRKPSGKQPRRAKAIDSVRVTLEGEGEPGRPYVDAAVPLLAKLWRHFDESAKRAREALENDLQ